VAVANIGNIGRIQLFFDGEAEPRVDVPAAEFFAGSSPGFPQPLVGDANSSSGGHFSYVPFCFARSLKMRVTAIPDDENLWYQLTELVLPHGTPVRTYEAGDLAAGEGAAALIAAGAPPAQEPQVVEQQLGAGDRLPLLERGGGGSIRFLRFSVTPFTAETLAGLELRVTADGTSEAQIAVPLGALFGDGLSTRAIRSTAFGMDPLAGSGYFALPIPYGSGVSAELRASTAANVRAEIWVGEALPHAGVLHGQRHVEHSRRGSDFTALAASGSGRLATWVLDLIGAPGSDMGVLQYFLEGDERVHLDGSPSPSIYGTGTEDAFNSGFYYSRGPLSLPTHGAGLPISRGDTRGARSQYRVFGGDGFLWEDGIRFGMEHGGGDELDDEITASTTFWYAGAARLRKADELQPADARSAAAHRLRGKIERRSLTAYFEGERDGNGPDSSYPITGGQEYPAPPPENSPEAVTAGGIEFGGSVSFELKTGRGNCGVILRRQLDALTPSWVDVSVDGRKVGPWVIAEANPSKRWLADDFHLPARHTAGKRRVRVTLTPAAGTTGTAFRLEALARRLPRCDTRPHRPRIRLRIRPARAVARRRTHFFARVRAREAGRLIPVRKARIRFAGHRTRTNAKGRATIVARLKRPGRHRACAAKKGLRRGCARVRIVRPN
jgi:hypothetical protein